MDIGRITIFIPMTLYCYYSFKKSKQNIYLIFATLAWYLAVYSGRLNLYQVFQDPVKTVLNMITILILFTMFFPYVKQSIREYKEYKSRN